MKHGLLLALLAAAACSRSAPHTLREPLPEVATPSTAPRPASPAPATGVPGSGPVAPGGAAEAGSSNAAQPPAAPTPGERPLRVLIFGDFGYPNAQQRAVTAMMLDAHRRQPFDLAFSLGDNVYDCGLDVTLPGAQECRFDATENAVEAGFEPPEDLRFRERFERPLLPLAEGPKPVPVYAVLGNHDVASGLLCREGGLGKREIGRVRACLQLAQRSPVWRMPGRHYVVDHGPARFIAIDSNLLIRSYGGFDLEDEIAFVREAVRGAAGRTVFLIAHHPAATAGKHRDEFDSGYVERLRRVLDAGEGKISGWFAGHDHDLQHLRPPGGPDVFVSGNGSLERLDERFERPVPPGTRQMLGSTARGFAVLEVRRAEWSVTFEVAGAKQLHCCRAAAGAACEPVACPEQEPPAGARARPVLP